MLWEIKGINRWKISFLTIAYLLRHILRHIFAIKFILLYIKKIDIMHILSSFYAYLCNIWTILPICIYIYIVELQSPQTSCYMHSKSRFGFNTTHMESISRCFIFNSYLAGKTCPKANICSAQHVHNTICYCFNQSNFLDAFSIMCFFIFCSSLLAMEIIIV